MRSSDQVSELLVRASSGRGAILSRREFRVYEGVSASELRENLRDVARYREDCRGKGSAEILGNEASADFGDAPAWIEAGAVYEDLVRCVRNSGALDYVFCLDPWAAQLRSRSGEVAGSARWVLISDLGERKKGSGGQYWEQLEGWFETLSFSDIVPKQCLDQIFAAEKLTVTTGRFRSLHAQKPGAWQWHRMTTGAPVVFLVRYSGSVHRLRVLLDSLVRQEGDGEVMHCLVLSDSEGDDPEPYLGWFAIAHPNLQPDLVRISQDWKKRVRRLLEEVGKATVVMLGDRTILPSNFLRLALEVRPQAALGVPLGREASVHILTGNLDPVQNYDALFRSAVSEQRPRTVSVRIFPPDSWVRAGEDSVSRLFRLAQEMPGPAAEAPLLALELADLP